MSESSRHGKAGRRARAAAALAAGLAFAPAASAAPDLIAGGTTTLAISHGFNKRARQAGIKVTAIRPTKRKRSEATLEVKGGEIVAGTGIGRIAHGGGLKLKLDGRSVAIRHIEIDTGTRSVRAKVAGKRMRLGRLTGLRIARVGFGDRIAARKLKLTGAGARALNKRLTPPPGRTRAKAKGGPAGKVVKARPPFRANTVIGRTVTEVEPETVTVLPGGATTFDADPTLLRKLGDVEAKVEVIPPTTSGGTTFGAPISGGTISPLGTMGQVDSSGGLRLTQDLPNGARTTITLGSIGVDLAAKTASAEVIGESNFVEPGGNPPRKPLNLGDLPRTSIADLRIADVVSSPATRTVAVAAAARIQRLAAEVLDGLVTVYQTYYEQMLEAKFSRSPAEARTAAEARVAPDHVKAGEPLGSFSLTVRGG